MRNIMSLDKHEYMRVPGTRRSFPRSVASKTRTSIIASNFRTLQYRLHAVREPRVVLLLVMELSSLLVSLPGTLSVLYAISFASESHL